MDQTPPSAATASSPHPTSQSPDEYPSIVVIDASDGAGPGLSIPSSSKHSVHSSISSNHHVRGSQAIAKSHGPSVLEQVVSKTRPSHLPPKRKDEDLKHLSVWEDMMKQSHAIEENRRMALQGRRLARELHIESQIPIWQRDIMPDWKVVYRDTRLRDLWRLGIPSRLREKLWAQAIDNSLALGKESYRTCLARSKRAISSGLYPSDIIQLVESDIATTLPSIKLFLPDIGPMYNDLKDFLLAWMVSRTDEGLGFYIMGAAKLGAMLLINMATSEQAFVALRNYLERGCMRAMYGGIAMKEDLEAYYRIFDTLLADYMPKIYFNFKQHQISPSNYLLMWLIPVFLDILPFEACARIWDVIVLEGDSFLFRTAIAILAVIESRLFFPDRQQLLDVLRGEDKAALEVGRRNGLDMKNGKFTVYGVDEESLWERLHELEEWWKDSTWIRLLQRELPDL